MEARSCPGVRRSHRTIVVGVQALVKAGLRPPPSAAAALTSAWTPTPFHQEIEGRMQTIRSTPYPTSPTQNSKEAEIQKLIAFSVIGYLEVLRRDGYADIDVNFVFKPISTSKLLGLF